MPRKKKTEEKKEENTEEAEAARETAAPETAESVTGKKESESEEKEQKTKVERLEIESLKKNSGEIENIIVKLAKEGMDTAKIGSVLRDTYGIPSARLIGKKIKKILVEKGVEFKLPGDIAALVKRADNLKKHLEKNKQDMTARRGLQLTEAKISKLSAYFRKKGALPQNWKNK